MKYEDFKVLYVFPEQIGNRFQKRCVITDGSYEYQVICGVDDDPILIFLEANQ